MSELLAELATNGGKLETAARWFNRTFSDVPLNPLEKRDFTWAAQRLGTGVMREVVALGANAAAEYHTAKEAHTANTVARRQKTYPEALKTREPGDPLYVIMAHFSQRADYEEYDNMLDPLVRVLQGNPREGYVGYGNRNAPNRTAELEEDGIQFLTIDKRHFEAEERAEHWWNVRLRLDDYAADTLIAMFGINPEEHGQAHLVLMYDPRAGQLDYDLAESVKARTGKYPYIGTATPPECPYEGKEKWDVYEYVPPVPAPVRPSLLSLIQPELVAS